MLHICIERFFVIVTKIRNVMLHVHLDIIIKYMKLQIDIRLKKKKTIACLVFISI